MINRNTDVDLKKDKDANRDPLTGTPGSHPFGTGLGAAAGGIAGGIGTGALAGSMGGPVGTVGWCRLSVPWQVDWVGKGVAEAIDPTVEEELLAQELHQSAIRKEGRELRRLWSGISARGRVVRTVQRPHVRTVGNGPGAQLGKGKARFALIMG